MTLPHPPPIRSCCITCRCRARAPRAAVPVAARPSLPAGAGGPARRRAQAPALPQAQSLRPCSGAGRQRHHRQRFQRHPGLPRLALRRRPLAAARPAGAAAVQRWLSVAAGEIAFGPAAARLAVLFGVPRPLDDAIARARGLFALMEPLLAGQLPRRQTRRRWPTWRPTVTSRVPRRAISRSLPIRRCVPGWRRSRPCRASCRCPRHRRAWPPNHRPLARRAAASSA